MTAQSQRHSLALNYIMVTDHLERSQEEINHPAIFLKKSS